MERERFCDRRAAALVLLSGLIAACNHNPVDVLSARATVGAERPVFSAAQQQLDVLWVVDNSGSMCQEQRFLAENFDKFIDAIADGSLDLQLGVTTTHVPQGGATLEPLAVAGHLQSRPQPLPAANAECRGSAADGWAPTRAALAAAVACMATPDQTLTQWTDAQLDCALRDQRDNTCAGVADRDADGQITTEDLFPLPSEYRALPPFLRSADYRGADGRLDVERLRADFACMALVGTRGTGYEKGLQAALLAVSPDLTAPGGPNAGFIRPDAGLSVVFVTDENDCSNDGSIQEQGDLCGASSCDYWNSPQLEDTSPLLKPLDFKQQFMTNLSQAKGRDVGEGEVIMAGILGAWRRFEGAYPVCDGRSNPAVPVACADASGERPVYATSGDRYERAIRQFANYFPNERTKADPLNLDVKEVGWMCLGDFSPALEQIGRFRPSRFACLSDALPSCARDSDCQPASIGGQAGRCVSAGATRFCDTSLRLEARRVEGAQAAVDRVEDQSYCQAGTIGALPGAGRGLDVRSCVIDPARYRWEACPAGQGVALVWEEGEAQAAALLTGYDVSVRYVLEVDAPEDGAAQVLTVVR